MLKAKLLNEEVYWVAKWVILRINPPAQLTTVHWIIIFTNRIIDFGLLDKQLLNQQLFCFVFTIEVFGDKVETTEKIMVG